jgi:hypothetical protein
VSRTVLALSREVGVVLTAANEEAHECLVITDDLVQMLGLNDAEYQILQELQIASLSILLHCRQYVEPRPNCDIF